jgi:hypothetical protein
MAVNYIGDNPLGPPAQGTIVELRQTQAVVQDSATRRRWGVLYAAIIPETSTGQPHVESTPPPGTQREEFFVVTVEAYRTAGLPHRLRRGADEADNIAAVPTSTCWKAKRADGI